MQYFLCVWTLCVLCAVELQAKASLIVCGKENTCCMYVCMYVCTYIPGVLCFDAKPSPWYREEFYWPLVCGNFPISFIIKTYLKRTNGQPVRSRTFMLLTQCWFSIIFWPLWDLAWQNQRFTTEVPMFAWVQEWPWIAQSWGANKRTPVFSDVVCAKIIRRHSSEKNNNLNDCVFVFAQSSCGVDLESDSIFSVNLSSESDPHSPYLSTVDSEAF
jgi:hypothetical protein